MENEGGTMIERQNEIDRLRRESDKLKRDIKDAKSKVERLRKKRLKNEIKLQKKFLAYSVNMKPKGKNWRLPKKGSTETKPLDELEVEEETLKRKIEEDQQILNDEKRLLRSKKTTRMSVMQPM